ncbi:MAG TPA: SDR family NAD(P)-dependent oxidoreductase, partial [Leifsonia sp.]|nr:SDR family NAD(P)-dependent oxidoreductase [Leifsonia sp.]
MLPENRPIDPDDLAATLRVLETLHQLDEEHPDFITVRRATAHMFKSVKQTRRKAIREAVAQADRAVVAATATGAPDRIDDETRGLDLSASAGGATAGTLRKSRACYICKQHYTQVDAFYHQLCPDCAAFSHAKRNARTDLTGKRAVLTGGRAKIGMHIALRLLRDGAHLTITTRFPRDAVRRFSSLPDSSDWLHRLRVVGIDLRDPAQVVALADSVSAQGPLDILINNAAQTVRRSPGSYSLLAEAESRPLPDGPLPEMETFGHTNDPHPQALEASVAAHPLLSVASLAGTIGELAQPIALTAEELATLAMAPGSSSLAKHADGTAIDAGGLVPDVNRVNSWTQAVQDVDPLEMLEVQLCNTTAPFLLISRLRATMAAAPAG